MTENLPWEGALLYCVLFVGRPFGQVVVAWRVMIQLSFLGHRQLSSQCSLTCIGGLSPARPVCSSVWIQLGTGVVV